MLIVEFSLLLTLRCSFNRFGSRSGGGVCVGVGCRLVLGLIGGREWLRNFGVFGLWIGISVRNRCLFLFCIEIYGMDIFYELSKTYLVTVELE